MHPVFTGLTILSFRNELKLVALTLLILLCLPLMAVFIIIHTGINTVSNTLVGVDATTRAIQIKDPANGVVIAEVSQAMAWPVQGVTTLSFGQSSGYQLFHQGIDIANREGLLGDPITPFMDGKVIYAGEIFWGYGKHIIIDHGNNISSVYAHLNRIYVFKGKEVNIGDVIGTMGSTGWSTGSHLHFEVRVFGIPVNPKTILQDMN